MRTIKLRACTLAVLLFWGLQSLADIALQEAERRKQLEEQGIKGKVIEGNAVPSSSGQNITTWNDATLAAPKKQAGTESLKNKGSARSFRTRLQKLDRAIRENEDRLQSRRARLQAQRWEIPKTSRVSSRRRKTDSQNNLQAEIEELEVKLKQLRRERAEIYEDGKKAGYLPGELDGHGVMP